MCKHKVKRRRSVSEFTLTKEMEKYKRVNRIFFFEAEIKL